MPSTRIEALLDVNVLIAALDEGHEHHPLAHPFVANLARFYTCPITQSGYLRFATRNGANMPGLTVDEAHHQLAELSKVPGHKFLADDIPFVGMSLRAMRGHKQWTDSYLLQLARHHRVRFASFDNRMRDLDDSGSPTLLIVGSS